MRYAECDACGRSLIGLWHINITRVTKPRGKHRNQKRTTINRLCGQCWTELKKHMPEKPAVETKPYTVEEEHPPCSICGGAFHDRSIVYEMYWEIDELAMICPECFKQISGENIKELNPRSIVKMLINGTSMEELELVYGVSTDALHKEHEEKYGMPAPVQEGEYAGQYVVKVVQLATEEQN